MWQKICDFMGWYSHTEIQDKCVLFDKLERRVVEQQEEIDVLAYEVKALRLAIAELNTRSY